MTIANRTFGIELEVVFPAAIGQEQLAARIQDAARVSVAAHRYGHTASDSTWFVKPDSSVQGAATGWEVVSPIMQGEAGIAECRRVCGALEAIGAQVNVSCGFHCHVGASDLTARHVAKLGQLFVWFEGFFDLIMPPSRRATNARFCASVRQQAGGCYTYAGLNRAFDAFQAAIPHGLQQVVTAVNPYGRYSKLNVGGMLRRNNQTVEFRQHSGTINADKVEHWIRLCVALVEKSKTTRVRRMTRETPLTSTEEMTLCFKMVPLPMQTELFYRMRHNALNLVERRNARRAQDATQRRAG